MSSKAHTRQCSRRVLFLQGPITPFFRDIANALEEKGWSCFRINLCFGDWLFWRGRKSTQYRGFAKNWPDFISSYLDEHAITDLVLLGEQRDYHKIAIEQAVERGIQVVTTDFGYLRPDWITFERNGMSANSEFPRTPEAVLKLGKGLSTPPQNKKYHDSFVRQVVWDMQYHLLSTVFRLFYPGYRSHQMYHPILVYLGTGLRLLLSKFYRDRRASKRVSSLIESGDDYFIFPLQMQNDFQIRAYSKYDNIQQALREVFASFSLNAPEHSTLVIKIHPLDPGLINWQRCCRQLAERFQMEDRWLFLDGGPLEELIEGSLGVVTINSTVGVWALRQHKPLCVLGEAIYRMPELVSEHLDSFWSRPAQPDAELADAFISAIAQYLHVRGVYYSQPGLANAVEEAVERLVTDRVNQVIF